MKFGALKFLKRATLTAAFAAASLGFYGYEVEPNMLKTTTYSIQSAKWNQGMPPLHVVAASDFHVGCPSVSIDRLKEIVERINAMKPDVIVLPGDFVTMIKDQERVIGGKYVAPKDIADVLKDLRAPMGVYAVLGNHDRMNDAIGMKDALEKVGIPVIDNDAVHVQKDGYDFWMVGLSDDTTSKPDWAKANAKIDNSAPVIVIMHDPGAFLDENNRPVVSIAAHTHGGQIVVPFFEHKFENPYSRAPMKYLYGHIVEGGRDLIVTSGIGTSIVPLRFGAKPEIVDIKISASKDAPKTVVAQPKAPVKPGPG